MQDARSTADGPFDLARKALMPRCNDSPERVPLPTEPGLPVLPVLPVQLTCRLVILEHQARVCVGGEVDIANAPELRAFMSRATGAGRTAVMIDLTDVTFIDSSGVRVLVLAAREAKAANIPFSLLCPTSNRAVRRVLELLQVELVTEIMATEG